MISPIAATDAKTMQLIDELKTELLERLRTRDNVHVYDMCGSQLLAVSTFAAGTVRPRLYAPPLLAHAGSVVSIETQVRVWITRMRESVAALGPDYENAPVLVMVPSLVPLTYKKCRVGPGSADGVSLLAGFQLLLIRQCELDSADVFPDDGTYGKHQAFEDAFKKTQ